MNILKLKVVGHDNSIDKPDENGFRLMRTFPNKKGVYSLKRWESHGNWTLQKKIGDTFHWIPLSNEQSDEIIKGERLLVDNDIVQKQ